MHGTPRKYPERLIRSKRSKHHCMILHSKPKAINPGMSALRGLEFLDIVYAYSILSIAAAISIKWQVHVVGKVCQVRNRILQCQILQILSGQLIIWRRFTPITVYRGEVISSRSGFKRMGNLRSSRITAPLISCA